MPSTLKYHLRSGQSLLTTAAVLTLGFLAHPADAATITFDDGLVAAGATLSNQYAPLGANFSRRDGRSHRRNEPSFDHAGIRHHHHHDHRLVGDRR